MRQFGFAPALQIERIEDFMEPGKRKRGVEVTWYAEKVKDPSVK